jgi:head-tail adaptor
MIGQDRQAVVFQNPTRTLDADGGYTDTFSDLAPGRWWASVTPAAPNDLERPVSGTVITQSTYLVRAWYHPGVTTRSRMLFDGRVFAIAGTRNVDERGQRMELLAVERVP